MQLVAYGAQDIYLTGNPQITFFKVVYRRHTNFAVEAIEQTYNGTVSSTSKVSVTVSRNGDLLSRVWLKANDGLTFQDIEYVECEIGGQVIDKQYGDWMTMWTELTQSRQRCFINCLPRKYVTAQFWFCRNPGLALPLIALQYQEVKLNIQWPIVELSQRYGVTFSRYWWEKKIRSSIPRISYWTNSILWSIISRCWLK